MIAVDADVLVRFFAADDPDQARRANVLLLEARRTGQPIVVTSVALLEAVWVWRRVFRVSKEEVLRVGEALLTTDPFFVLERDAVEEAADAWRTGGGDFPEYLTRAQARRAGATRVATFDRDVSGEPGFFEP